MKQLLHLKTMLVTLLTMLVAMNASAQTQNYYSEGFENWSNGNASRNGWTIDQGSYVQRGNGHAHTGTYALQIGSGTGSSPSNIVTPFLGKSGSIPSSAVMTLWFCMDNLDATITLSAEGGATISSITPNKPAKVTCTLDNGTAVVSASSKGDYYMLTINLTGCNTNTKLRIKTTHRTYIDDLLVTGEADQRTPVTLEYSADKYTTATESGEITDAPTLTVTPPEAAQYVVFSSSDENVAKFENGKLIAVAPGTTTITASISGNETYRDAKDEYTLTVGLPSSNLKFNPESATVTYGDDFTAPTLSWANGYDKNLITFTSSNENVATVVNMDDDGKVNISIHAVGVATIKASGAGTPYLKESEATFTLTVNDIQGSVTGGTGGSVFKETFNKVNGTGGNDNKWSGDIATNDLNPSGDNKNVDENDWTFTKGNGANQCARFGTGSAVGSATTRQITVTEGQDYMLTFKAAPWASDKSNTMNVSVNGGTIKNMTGSMEKGQWNVFSATITPTSSAITITFAVTGSEKRFFLDEINVAAPSTSETVDVKIPASGWGTFCYKYPLDFTAASSPEGLKAYAVSSTSSSNATLTQITEKIIGGTGIIINGTPGTTYTINVADKGTAYSGTNLLTGTLAPTYVEEGQYFLKSGRFVYSSAGILPANKAYLKKENAPEAAANFGFVTEDATGISEVLNNISLDDDKWYDLSGRAVSPTSKGIYIHNGKKYVIK
ncbi:MAG: hypothetical protein IKH08_11935 [Prevotella sp.]|nr:hypothetical protein [Prevotella sp.]